MSEPEPDPRPVVCVDLNGVLDRYTGWQHEKHWDPPREGAEDFLRALNERGFRVVVFTTRWEDDARAWLAEHGLDRWVSEVTDRKPAAHVFVDDRAVCFQGDFGETLEQILGFRAHWEAAEDPVSPPRGPSRPREGAISPREGAAAPARARPAPARAQPAPARAEPPPRGRNRPRRGRNRPPRGRDRPS